jgi:hypothetical protein
VWWWQPDPDIGYFVSGAYQLLTSHDTFTAGEDVDLVWHKQIPSKVSIFAWRLLRDRLPTKENLVACGILSSEAHFCVSGCGSIETAQHLFLLAVRLGPCGHLFAIGLAFQRLMPLLSVIIWFSSHSQLEVHELVGRFCSLFGLQVSSVTWNERNHRLFNNAASLVHLMLDKVKMFSFRWLKTTNVTLASYYHTWWSNSLLCLGIDWFSLYILMFLLFWYLCNTLMVLLGTSCDGVFPPFFIYI